MPSSFIFSVLTGRAEHQTAVFHIPLADLVVISGVPPARCHPYLGHLVFRPGQIPLPHLGLLCHAHVSSCSLLYNIINASSCSQKSLLLLFISFHRLIRDNLLAGDFTVNMRLLQVRLRFTRTNIKAPKLHIKNYNTCYWHFQFTHLRVILVFQDYPISDVHTILTKAKELQDNS